MNPRPLPPHAERVAAARASRRDENRTRATDLGFQSLRVMVLLFLVALGFAIADQRGIAAARENVGMVIWLCAFLSIAIWALILGCGVIGLLCGQLRAALLLLLWLVCLGPIVALVMWKMEAVNAASGGWLQWTKREEKAAAAPPPAAPADLSAKPPPRAPVNDWRDYKDRKGRTLEARLLFAEKGADGLFTGTFVRRDGSQFTYKLGDLSAPDVEFLRKGLAEQGVK